MAKSTTMLDDKTAQVTSGDSDAVMASHEAAAHGDGAGSPATASCEIETASEKVLNDAVIRDRSLSKDFNGNMISIRSSFEETSVMARRLEVR